jgi:hypothetical protein
MNEKRERLAFRPSGPVRAAIEQIHELTGRPRAEIVAEMLDAVAPMFAEQVVAIAQLAATPDRARDYVRDLAIQGINTLSQQVLDLPPVRPKRGRPRKHASP